MDIFNFYKDKKNLSSPNDRLVRVSKGISDKLQIFVTYENQLNIPSYYGKNWDAFDDNLMSLAFVRESNVVVVHDDIPFSENHKERQMYIETLSDTIKHWREFPEHKFYVYFPESCKEEVKQIIESRPYD